MDTARAQIEPRTLVCRVDVLALSFSPSDRFLSNYSSYYSSLSLSVSPSPSLSLSRSLSVTHASTYRKQDRRVHPHDSSGTQPNGARAPPLAEAPRLTPLASVGLQVAVLLLAHATRDSRDARQRMVVQEISDAESQEYT